MVPRHLYQSCQWRVVRLVVVAVSTDVNRSRYDGERYEFMTSYKGKTSFILQPRRQEEVSEMAHQPEGTKVAGSCLVYVQVHCSLFSLEVVIDMYNMHKIGHDGRSV